MSDVPDDRPSPLRELDQLRLDPAPVAAIVDAGHRVRRRRRTTLASVAAVSVLLVGGGLVATQVVGEDTGTAPADATTGPPVAEPRDLDVTVVPSDLPDRAGRATWDPLAKILTYTTSTSSYGGCTPDGSATVARTTLTLVLVSTPADSLCRAGGRTATVTVHGLTEAPTELVVTEGDDTSTVPVREVEAPDPTVTVAAVRIGEEPLERGAARWDAGLSAVLFVPTATYDACLTEGAATSTRTTVDLSLTAPAITNCFEPALSALVTIGGLAEAPVDLRVVEDGRTTVVPVLDPAASDSDLPDAMSLCPDGTGSVLLFDRDAPPAGVTLDDALAAYTGAAVGPRGASRVLGIVADGDRTLRVLPLARWSNDSWYVTSEVRCGS